MSTGSRTLIRNGLVVNSDSSFRADVLIVGGRIEALSQNLEANADRVIDAEGKFVMPGGIDVHTHFEYPVGGFVAKTVDDFSSGTRAAAMGGTTTVIDFVKTKPGGSIYETFQRRRADAESRAYVDFSLHPIVPPWADQDGLGELRKLARTGARSWKFFMAYQGLMTEDSLIIQGFRACKEEGVLPIIHAENGHMVEDSTRGLVLAGMTAPRMHLAAHTARSEGEAVRRAIELAQHAETPIYIVHVSSENGVDAIAGARADGLAVYGESCPQYLCISAEEFVNGDDEDAAIAICCPPIRETMHQHALWRGIASGAISTVATDHAVFPKHADENESGPYKCHDRFTDVPNGVPGVQERLQALWSKGVVGGRISANRFVDLVSTRPAALFGLLPRKGVVAVGSDADIVVWDPTRAVAVDGTYVYSAAGYSLYAGQTFTGYPVHVFSRGEQIVAGGQFSASRGRGVYLERTSAAYEFATTSAC